MNTTTSPVWELLYSAKEEYGLNDLSPVSWDLLINKIIYEKSIYSRFVRNSIRRDNFICERKCRYNLLCNLRKGHHNMTLCNHLPFPRNSRNFKSYLSYKLPGTVDNVGKTTLTITKQQQQQQYANINMLLKKKLRSYILKRFFQLFLLSQN
ncbi:unnamed protein product [Brugia timori]|nr:unnamed protein product [Brugia timori]